MCVWLHITENRYACISIAHVRTSVAIWTLGVLHGLRDAPGRTHLVRGALACVAL